MKSPFQCIIKPAVEADVPAIYSLLMELAEYEKLQDTVISTENDIHTALFGDKPVAEALLAFVDNKPVGVAVFFLTFSTFVGRPGMYLEDIYVQPAMRGKKIGSRLLIRLAQIARERNYGRIEWAVLNWNKPAIDFYESINAKPLHEWTTYRLSGENIDTLANAQTEEA